MKRRLRVLWCVVTLRHKGHVHHDERGIYWMCDRCTHRVYVEWEDVVPAIMRMIPTARR